MILKPLDFLITYLVGERNEKLEIENLSEEEKKRLFRSLCNIREPKEISQEFLNIQDMYLQEEIQEKGIAENIEESRITDNIYLWKGDITTLKIDAIVNAANSQGLGCFIPCHKCIDNSIHSYSGIQLRLECYEVFMTKGYNLLAKYIIHTVGPIIYEEVTDKEREELKNCYIHSLQLAKENNIKEIAFPCISTGEFRFPKEEACQIAIKAVKEYLAKNENWFKKVVFNVFTEENDRIYGQNILI